MDLISSLAIIILAALVHASFQLTTSVLTLMSGHAIGSKIAYNKLLRLTNSFMLGVGVMTLLLLAASAFIATTMFDGEVPLVVWTVWSGILVGLGVSVWMFYYRKARGTTLWLPRGIAAYLSARSKQTRSSGEAFSLGLTSVVTELLFLLGPIVVSALTLVNLTPYWQVIGLGLYTVISLFSLLVVGGLIGSGHTLGGIQKWRESHKHFLQFAAGWGLLILGFYIYVTQVLSTVDDITGAFW